MQNKRKIIMAGIFLLALAAAVIMVVLTNGRKKKGSGKNGPEIDEADIKVIRFAIPSDLCKVQDEFLKYFNEALLKDGHPYRLELEELGQAVASDVYRHELETQLKNGGVDVAFMGPGIGGGENWVYDMLRSGLVLNLEEILSGDKGKVIYEAFPKNLWESGKCDGHIYSIPTGVTTDNQGVFAAFNKNYVSDADIEKWDGTIDGLYEILKKADWSDNTVPRFQYLIDGFEFDGMLKCEISFGLLFDYETLTVENPLQSEKLMHYLKVLDQMKKDGYVGITEAYIYDSEYDPQIYKEEVWNRIADGQFVAALSESDVDDEFKQDFITVKRLSPYLESRINGSIAISKNAADVDAVVDFLTLLYGEGKYANILLYGREGVDYKVVDGVARKMDGSVLEPELFDRMCLNLSVNVYPGSGDRNLINRRDDLFAYFESTAKSPFLGFEPDTAKLGGIAKTMNEFIIETGRKDTSLDETAAAAADKLKADLMDDYLDSVRSQWEDFRK